MSSEQQQRRRADEKFERVNTDSDRDVHVEQGRAHKMASHFESLADKDSGTAGGVYRGEAGGGQAGGEGHDTLVGRVAVIEVGIPAEKTEMKIGDQGGLKTEAASATGGGAGTHGNIRDVGGEMQSEQKRGGGGTHGVGTGRQMHGAAAGGGGMHGAAAAGGQMHGAASGGGGMHGAAAGGGGGEKLHQRGDEQKKGGGTQAAGAGGGGGGKQSRGGQETAEKQSRGQSKESELSLEEIAKLRGLAQQNSMETLQEIYDRNTKATSAVGTASEIAAQKASQAKEIAAQKASQAKETVTQGAQTTAQYVADKAVAAKDTAVEKAQQGYQAAKDYTVPKAVETKDYTAQKAVEAKDKAAEVTKNAAGYAGEKAVAAKDTAVEKSKVAAEYTGKVASDVKDKAAVAGWGAAHYTTEKTVEGTKMVARAVEGVAGKVGEVVAGAGHVAADLAKKSLSAAKDTAISTEESVAEYTARKREEAERQLREKNSETQVNVGEGRQGTLQESQGSMGVVAGAATVTTKATLGAVGDTMGVGAGAAMGTAKAAAGAVGDILSGPPEQENLFSPAAGVVREGAKITKDTVQGTAAMARDTVGGVFQGQQQRGGPTESGAHAVKGTTQSDTVKGAVRTLEPVMDTVSGKIVGSEEQGGVLGAIGETIAEIAQTTKDIVVGPGEVRTEAALGYPEEDVTDSSKTDVTGQRRLQRNQ